MYSGHVFPPTQVDCTWSCCLGDTTEATALETAAGSSVLLGKLQELVAWLSVLQSYLLRCLPDSSQLFTIPAGLKPIPKPEGQGRAASFFAGLRHLGSLYSGSGQASVPPLATSRICPTGG